MKKRSIAFLILLSTPTLASDFGDAFGDAKLGKIKSPSCIYCHGTNGITDNTSYPNIQGQDPTYLFNAMKAYQNGERAGPLASMMQAQLQKLTDDDLKDIAAYYSESQ
ncbi:c-type cytochrome [Vibrio genomosp. F10]|uniref:Cytochrome C554 n=1 Tax=Vibrio genomosp. F10 TaxID=723171 RepID=A0A1B9QUS3_9VIBR|nr:cytochrome c [Vibrio genomosp. F10]OCH71225.1 cytochrome C554 [Vibrio genomosp. F10]